MVESRGSMAGTRVSRLLRFIRRMIIVFLWLIAITGFHVLYGWPAMVSVALFLALPLIAWRCRLERILTIGAVMGFLGMIACLTGITPSNNRDWMTEFSVLPRIRISDQQVII